MDRLLSELSFSSILSGHHIVHDYVHNFIDWRNPHCLSGIFLGAYYLQLSFISLVILSLSMLTSKVQILQICSIAICGINATCPFINIFQHRCVTHIQSKLLGHHHVFHLQQHKYVTHNLSLTTVNAIKICNLQCITHNSPNN
jgi:hypothetical protein